MKKHEKPSLDEQRLEELSSILNYALATKNKVRIPFTMFGTYHRSKIRVTPRASETKSIKSTD
ncbi:hypothetical protein B1222_23750 (plasmid) [Paenibacillus larvae subsp. pulvifaciens]|uniref:YolD-like family protein n=1 Tax=Paenibacillus larvae TaxID=1464 RepID=UPI00098F9DAF|nr:hypothetical protein B1222_23750 [Paenibacillus larvae subsp. pulvifaciens]AQZ49365.1 hypothetical protein B5S25_22950 [Paenibacillus larvae subsp. pulvifaciens]